jgi:uncharacterized RDD family membrane protein YckC
VSVATRRARADLVRGRRAGVVSRLLAGGIDLVATAVILFGLLVGFSTLRYIVGVGPLRLPRPSALFSAAAFPLVEVGYLATTWSASGRSIGKEIVGLRAVRAAGTRLEPWRAFLRAAVCTVLGGPFLLWALVSSRNAAIHDLALRTAVVHDWSDEVRTA